MKLNQLHPIGSFQVESGSILITDPCYYHEEQGAGLLAMKGTWQAYVYIVHEPESEMTDNAILIAYHSDYPVQLKKAGWVSLEYGTGVDSGQAGFFDKTYFNDASVVKEVIEKPLTGKNLWYDLCCNRTIDTKLGAGVIPFGVVSRSGIGDGYYPAYGQYFGEALVALGLDFQILPPINFIPNLDKQEEELLSLVELEDKNLKAYILANPQIDLDWFVNYSLYSGREEALELLLEQKGNSEGLDLGFLISENKLACFERIKWLISDFGNPEELLSYLRWKSAEEAILWSQKLSEIGFSELICKKPILLEFANALHDAKLPLLEYWVEKGLQSYVFDEDNFEDQFSKKPLIKAYLLAHQAKWKITQDDLLGKMAKIKSGIYSNFIGLVVKQEKGQSWLKINIFGRDMEAEVPTKDLELVA